MVKRIFVGSNFFTVQTEVPDFDQLKDMYVSTSAPGSTNKLMGMLPRAEWTYLMRDAEEGKYWPKVRDTLDYRLMRSRERISDCQRWTTST